MSKRNLKCYWTKSVAVPVNSCADENTDDPCPSKRPKLELESESSKPEAPLDSQDGQAADIQGPSLTNNPNLSLCCDMSNPQFIKDSLLGLDVVHYSKFLKSDARAIMQQLEKELPPYFSKNPNEVVVMGKVHKIPRKQAAFGDEGLSYNFSGVSVSANGWIPILEKLRDCLQTSLKERFNFVLVNRYKDGLDHIGEHRDDEADLVPRASIASLSLGQERDFVFKHRLSRGKNAKRKDIEKVTVPLKSGSLLVMKYPTNTHWYHSLPTRKKALGPRINLTFRVMRN